MSIDKRIFFLFFFFLLSLFASARDAYKIGFLIDDENPSTEKLLAGIRTEIVALIGEDADILYPDEFLRVNSFDKEKAQNNYVSLLNSDCDIIICHGFFSIISVFENGNFDKPIVFLGSIPEDFTEGLNKDSFPEIKNAAFLMNSFSFRQDLETFQQIYDYDFPGIAVTRAIADNLPLRDLLTDIIGDSEGYKMIVFDKPEDILEQLEGIDAIYLAGGFRFNDDQIREISDELIKRKIPSFAALDARAVQIGLLASNQKTKITDRIIRRTALEVESFINQTGDSDLSLYMDSEKELTINFNTAEKLELPLRYSIMASTNAIGSLDSLAAEKRYTLKMVFDEALENNLGINAVEKDVELATQDVKSATSSYLPSLNAGASANYTDPDFARIAAGRNPEVQTSGNVSLNQIIYSPEASAGVGIRKDLQKAEIENLNSQKLNLLLDASIAYFNALFLKNTLRINYSNLKVTEENLQIAIDKYEAGQQGKIDILRFESQKAQNMQQYVESINGLKQSFFDLNQILNQPIERPIDVDDAEVGRGIFKTYSYDTIKKIIDDPNLLKPFTSFLVEEAKRNAPELRNLQFGKSAAERDRRLNTGGRFLPTVSLGGQYNAIFSRSGEGTDFPPGFPQFPDSYYTLGVNVSIPLIQQNLQNINSQSATIRMEQIDLQKDNFELSIERNVNSAVLNLINQISNIELSEVSLNAAEENLELTQQAYASGAVTYIQLIDAQTNYFQAQLANANAVYNYLLSVISLERNIGSFFLMNTPEYTEDFNARFRQYLLDNN